MGMYNEVRKDCPKCGTTCHIQISQVVLGFGEFNLDDLETFEELDESELRHFKRCVEDKVFMCECGYRFLYNSEEYNRTFIIKKILFG